MTKQWSETSNHWRKNQIVQCFHHRHVLCLESQHLAWLKILKHCEPYRYFIFSASAHVHVQALDQMSLSQLPNNLYGCPKVTFYLFKFLKCTWEERRKKPKQILTFERLKVSKKMTQTTIRKFKPMNSKTFSFLALTGGEKKTKTKNRSSITFYALVSCFLVPAGREAQLFRSTQWADMCPVGAELTHHTEFIH